jgi:ArsR family transcriptional regulator
MKIQKRDKRVYELHAEVCKAFAHPKRIEILNLLAGGEKSVGELVEEMGIAKANVSQHLALLRQLGAVGFRRAGQTLYYRLANPKIIQACRLMHEVLLERLAEEESIIGAARRGRKRR